MPHPDATAIIALDQNVVIPAFFIWLDVVDDPIRITNFAESVTFSGTGDVDLDGFTFSNIRHELLGVGEVSNAEGGSNTLTIELSGIRTIDSALLAGIGDTAKWRGRSARLWFRLYDEADAPQGGVVPYYTGYMSSVKIDPSPEVQAIRLQVENYLASFNQASNRSYLNQKDYDPTDTSPEATMAAVNGARKSRSGSAAGRAVAEGLNGYVRHLGGNI